MEAAVANQFECPVCLSLPPKEVYQCRNGHTICHKCVAQLTNCPECRVVYDNPKIRSRALEKVLELMKQDCPNKKLGCAAKLSKAEVSTHSSVCPYGGETIKLCNMLDLSCDYSLSFRRLQEAVDHFQTKHGFGVCDSKDVNVYLENFHLSSLREGISWPPTIVNRTRTENRFYMIVCKHQKPEASLSLSCLEIIHDSVRINAASNEFRVTISSPQLSKERGISLLGYCVQRPKFDEGITDPMCRVLTRHSLAMCNRENQLLIKCCIQEPVHFRKPINKTVARVYVPGSTNYVSVPNPKKIQVPSAKRNVGIPKTTQSSDVPSTNATQVPSISKRAQKQSEKLSNFLSPWDPNVDFNGFRCNYCNSALKGLCYICVPCCTNLCMACYEKDEHVSHLCFVLLKPKVVSQQPTPMFRRNISSLRESRKQMDRAEELGEPCRTCGSYVMVVCAECRLPKGYCKICIKKLAPTNPCLNHWFVVIRSRKQELDVLAVLKFLPDNLDTLQFLWNCYHYNDNQ